MRFKLVWALAAAAAVCAIPQAGAFNPQPDPPGLQALIDDINALPAAQNPRRTRSTRFATR